MVHELRMREGRHVEMVSFLRQSLGRWGSWWTLYDWEKHLAVVCDTFAEHFGLFPNWVGYRSYLDLNRGREGWIVPSVEPEALLSSMYAVAAEKAACDCPGTSGVYSVSCRAFLLDSLFASGRHASVRDLAKYDVGEIPMQLFNGAQWVALSTSFSLRSLSLIARLLPCDTLRHRVAELEQDLRGLVCQALQRGVVSFSGGAACSRVWS
jgi:hypothetical protein